MESHGLSPYPPEFKFEIIQSFKDPLSRQLCEALEIVNSGNLNQKTEFKLNDLCRLVSDRTDREKEEEVETARLERNILDQHLNSFINVMKDVEEKEKKTPRNETNPSNIFRLKQTRKRGEEGSSVAEGEERKGKRIRMESSTPKPQNYRLQKEESPDQISPIAKEGVLFKLIQRSSTTHLGLMRSPPGQGRKQRCLMAWTK